MFEIIRDAAKVGLGALSLSKENIKKITDDLVEIGKVSRNEGDRLFKEMQESSDDYRKSLQETIEESVKTAVDRAGFAMKSDVADLHKKIEELEAQLKDRV